MKIEKVQKLVPNLHDKTEFVIHIRNFKQSLNHGLVLKKVHTVNKFSQNTRLKKNIDMKTDLRKHRHIKLVTTEKRRNYCFILYIKETDDIYEDIAV